MKRTNCKTFFQIIFIAIIFFRISYSQTKFNNYDPNTLIVKLKSNSKFFKLLRKAVPSSIEKSLTIQNSKNVNQDIRDFFHKNNVFSIKGIKTGADEEELPGGIERIFIIELNDTNLIEKIHFFMQTDQFEYIEKDYFAYLDDSISSQNKEATGIPIIPNDPYFYTQWGLRDTGQKIGGVIGIPGADIDILPAWSITTGNQETIVGLLDTGVPLNNPDLEGRIIPGENFINIGSYPLDDDGHGTIIAGIIGANGNNKFMVSGINWQCKILAVKLFDSTGLSQVSNWIMAFVYASDHGAKVINISSAVQEGGHAIQDAINYSYASGSIIVTSMGNDNTNALEFPAAYSNVIAVGSINNQNIRSNFSNYGPFIDFMAPGEYITGLYYREPNTLSVHYGTSMSTAFVSGVVSLMVGLKSKLTFQDVYSLLKNNAKDQIGFSSEDIYGWDQFYGWGCIDAGQTIRNLADTTIFHTIPENYYLNQNYPNPFNLSTTLEFGIANPEHVNLDIYNIMGEKIISLVNQNKLPGRYIIYWDAYDCASDIYFCVLRTSKFSITKKLILLK